MIGKMFHFNIGKARFFKYHFKIDAFNRGET